MEQILIIFLVFAVLFLSFLFFKKGQTKDEDSLIARQLYQFDSKMQVQHEQNIRIVRDITEKLTNLERTNKQVVDFSEQLNNLEKILTNQKQRGSLGEIGLQAVLENILPPTSFSMQYSFEDGDRVDAVIFTKDGMIPVDAKFS
ncbi:MAG: DNA recombination protein RmuC, partial [Candidatus Paceibacterota bacterium]